MVVASNKTVRQSPKLPTKDEIQATMAAVLGASAPPAPHWVGTAVAMLRAIRDGKQRDPYISVDGVRLVDRQTYDTDGRIYLHLTVRAHELLRANGGLPWGA